MPDCSEIQKDFGFTDQQKDQLIGGWIAATFFLVGAPSALLMGALTQSHSRRNLLFIIVLLGALDLLCRGMRKAVGFRTENARMRHSSSARVDFKF